MLSGVAVVATGLAVSSGILTQDNLPTDSASAAMASAKAQHHQPGVTIDLGDRTRAVSRSDRRTPIDAAKEQALSQDSGGQTTKTEDLAGGDPRDVARAMLGEFGFSSDQFGCLDSLYNSESGWNVHADNPSSSAYGIPQALPGSKMSSAGADWADNPATQIRWGLGYIRTSYGTPCGAWSFKQGHGWY
jgi:hypothetical protein